MLRKMSTFIAAPLLLCSVSAFGDTPPVTSGMPLASLAETQAAAELCYAATTTVGPVDTTKFTAAGWAEQAVPADLQSALGDHVFRKAGSPVMLGTVAKGKINGCKVTTGVAKDLDHAALMQSLDTLYKSARSADSTPNVGRWVWLAHMARAEFFDLNGTTLVTIFVADMAFN